MDPIALRLVIAAAGLVVCFRGYSAFKVALALTSFLVGAHAATLRADLLPRHPAWAAPALILGAGLLAAILVLAVYRLGVLLLGAAALVLLALQAPALLPHDTVARVAVLAAVALVGALLARFLERVALSVATALYGAFMVASAAAPAGGAHPGTPPDPGSLAPSREPSLAPRTLRDPRARRHGRSARARAAPGRRLTLDCRRERLASARSRLR